jgi:transcriptional regulator with XRE-family HTH domain
MDNPPKVGQNILKIRSRKKLTLNALSERSGISKGMLSQIESEKGESDGRDGMEDCQRTERQPE